MIDDLKLKPVDSDPAVVDALRSNPVLVIANAKKGSFKDVATLADHADLVPPQYICDVLAIFCSQMEGDPASALRRNPQRACTSAATIMRGIINLWSKSSEASTPTLLGPILMKSWPKIELWIKYLDVASKFKEKNFKDGSGDIELLVQGLFPIALGCKDSKSKAYFEKRVPSGMAKKWLAEKTPGDHGFCATNALAPCLQIADNKRLFLTTFIRSTGITELEFIVRLLQQGKILLRQTQEDFCAIGSYLLTLLAVKLTPLAYVWEVLLDNGGLAFVLRVFVALSKQTRASDGWRSSFNTCVKFFREALTTKQGHPFLLEMIKGGFLESFINCSPRLGELKASEISTCKEFLTFIPRYFYLFTVLKCVSSAFEKIGSEGRQSLRGTCVEEGWIALETRLLEQLIRKKMFDNGSWHGQGFCFNCKKDNIDGTFLKCAGCRRALYCSRECQKVDWKEGGHRGDCQTCAVMSELDYLDERSMRKCVDFAAMITRKEMVRHFPSLRARFHSKLPGYSMGQARLFAEPTSLPVVLDIGSVLEILEGMKYLPVKGVEETMKMAMAAPDDKHLWVQMSLPGGQFDTSDLMKLNYPTDSSGRSKSRPESVQIRRPVAVDSTGLELEAQWDEVDDVLHALKFKSVDEWYASGPGSLDRLNKKLESILPNDN